MDECVWTLERGYARRRLDTQNASVPSQAVARNMPVLRNIVSP